MNLVFATTQQDYVDIKNAIKKLTDPRLPIETKKCVWIRTNKRLGDNTHPFTVIDNRQGQCLVEDFYTLDGAMMFALDIRCTTENQAKWDKLGQLAREINPDGSIMNDDGDIRVARSSKVVSGIDWGKVEGDEPVVIQLDPLTKSFSVLAEGCDEVRKYNTKRSST